MTEHYFGFTTRKARKNHYCDFCYKPIRKNTRYHYHSMIYDDSYCNYKRHRLCTFMNYETFYGNCGESADIQEYSHPEDRRNLIDKAKAAIKKYKSQYTRFKCGGVL